MAMHTWFECKIRYEKTMENGMIQKVTESYLVDALSFTEAEARIIEEVNPVYNRRVTVSDITRIQRTFVSDEEAADRWFKCRLVFYHPGRKERRREESHLLCAGTGRRPA